MAEYNPLIRNFLPPKRTKRQPRYNVGVDTCIECGRQRGLAYQTHCDLCGRVVCVDCRRDANGNALRSIPYICSHCKQAQDRWLNMVVQTPQETTYQTNVQTSPNTQQKITTTKQASVKDVIDDLINNKKASDETDAFDRIASDLLFGDF